MKVIDLEIIKAKNEALKARHKACVDKHRAGDNSQELLDEVRAITAEAVTNAADLVELMTAAGS